MKAGSGKQLVVQAWEAFATRDPGRVRAVFAPDAVAIDFRGIYADGDTVIVEERMQAALAHGGRYDNDYCSASASTWIPSEALAGSRHRPRFERAPLFRRETAQLQTLSVRCSDGGCKQAASKIR